MKQVDFTDIPLAARPSDAKVRQVLIEQAAQGQAILLQDGDVYAVRFPDESETIPFDRLRYNKQLGLYDKRHFPNLDEE